ncbi:hypothetical protein [Eubacterium ramulus]
MTNKVKKKRPYKIKQIPFQTQKEYIEFHQQAVTYMGVDNQYTDTQYIRECIEKNKKEKTSIIKKRSFELVKCQEVMNQLILQEKDIKTKELLIKLAEESIELWAV